MGVPRQPPTSTPAVCGPLSDEPPSPAYERTPATPKRMRLERGALQRRLFGVQGAVVWAKRGSLTERRDPKLFCTRKFHDGARNVSCTVSTLGRSERPWHCMASGTTEPTLPQVNTRIEYNQVEKVCMFFTTEEQLPRPPLSSPILQPLLYATYVI